MRPISKVVLAVFWGASMLLMCAFAQAKTLVFCSEGSPEGFNPIFYTTKTTFDASSRTIYNRLVEFERGTLNIQPALAESWDVSADGRVYNFYLRKGVKFHTTEDYSPSREFNADDVVFSFKRQLDVDHPFYKVSGGNYTYFEAMGMPALLKDVVRSSEYSVKFILNRPAAPFLANLAMDFSSIFSAEYADKMMSIGSPEVIDQKPIGTGPFQLVTYKKDSVILFKAHPEYWAGKAAIDNLVFTITQDASSRYQMLKAGECHVMSSPNLTDLKEMSEDSELNLLKQEGLNVGYMAYNTLVSPFDNPRVRKALNMAINKQAIIDAVFLGAGKIAKNPIPPTIWSYNNEVIDDPYDPELAREILEQEGVKGLKMKIWAMSIPRPYNPNTIMMAELIQADFAEVGVEAEIVTLERDEYLKRSKDKDRDGAVLHGWTGDNGDPDNFLGLQLGCEYVGGLNRAMWCYPPYEELIQKAQVISDKKERTKLYEQAQLVFKEQAPWATISHTIVFQPMRKEVVNFKIDPFGGHVFYGVDLNWD